MADAFLGVDIDDVDDRPELTRKTSTTARGRRKKSGNNGQQQQSDEQEQSSDDDEEAGAASSSAGVAGIARPARWLGPSVLCVVDGELRS